MVDVYHLFKLGTATAKILKASKGTYNAVVIFKNIWKPMVVMGAMGVVDSACDELVDKAVTMITEEANNGCSK